VPRAPGAPALGFCAGWAVDCSFLTSFTNGFPSVTYAAQARCQAVDGRARRAGSLDASCRSRGSRISPSSTRPVSAKAGCPGWPVPKGSLPTPSGATIRSQPDRLPASNAAPSAAAALTLPSGSWMKGPAPFTRTQACTSMELIQSRTASAKRLRSLSFLSLTIRRAFADGSLLALL
jgi:hypothetical protein